MPTEKDDSRPPVPDREYTKKDFSPDEADEGRMEQGDDPWEMICQDHLERGEETKHLRLKTDD